MSSWDSCEISCNKIMMLHTLRSSSLNLLHNMLQPVLSFQAVMRLSAVMSIVSHAVACLCIFAVFLTHCSSVKVL
jgi:hypothetical protein